MAPEIQPVLDPADHALMLTPDQLRNQNSKNVNVSFLRKTQYMTSQNARANDAFIRPNTRTSKPTRRSSINEPQIARDDPINIKRHIQKGFDIAYPDTATSQSLSTISSAELSAWRTPIHPDNPRLKPVSYYPILPDLESSTDADGYISMKFDKPPLPALPNHGGRDSRIDVALLHGEADASQEAAWSKKKQAYEENPELYDNPGDQPYQWDFCVPRRSGADVVAAVKRKLNIMNPNRDDDRGYEGLYVPGDPKPHADIGIDYVKERSFGAVSTETPNVHFETLRFMAVSLFDSESAREYSHLGNESAAIDRAAYYYPIIQKMRVRADREKIRSRARDTSEAEQKWNYIKLTVQDPDIEEQVVRAQFRNEIDDSFQEEFEQIKQTAKESGIQFDDGDDDRTNSRRERDAVTQRAATSATGEDDVEMSDPPAEAHAEIGTNGFADHSMED
jgi:RNA polymerase II-associated factor 1